MDRLGLAHTVLAVIALVLGAVVVARRKGDRLHRTVGHLYVASMLGVNVTAFHIYDLFGRFGPFHVAAAVSSATLVAAMVPVVARWPRRTWYHWHANFMGWSYVGLVAAAVSEASVRIPSTPFGPAVMAATLSVIAIGGYLIHGRKATLTRGALRKAGFTTVAVAGMMLPQVGGAQETPDSALARHAASLERAVAAGDRASVAATRAELAVVAARAPEHALALHYVGYAWYREATLPGAGNDGGTGAALDSAARALRASGRVQPIAETHALLATVIGLQIGNSPWRGMLFGHRINAEMGRATELERDNPRVALLQGINAFHTPGPFGGGMGVARAALERAVQGFAGESPHAILPRWGHAEAWAWLGRVRARAGDRADAREAYERALAIDPEYKWVSDVLLPRLGDEPR